MKTTHADDNPNHEDREREKQAERDKLRDAQRDRDASERKLSAAKGAAAIGTDASAEFRNEEAQQGRGPSGLNTGPSDTVSRDPHNPSQAPMPTTGGTGATPPRGAGTHDASGNMLGNGGLQETDEQRRARLNGSDEAQDAGKRSVEEQRRANEAKQDAQDGLRQAERKIAENQSPGVHDRAADNSAKNVGNDLSQGQKQAERD